MTDIARVGFRADTSELKDAKATLDSLAPSAEKVERAARGAGNGMDQAAQGAVREGTAVDNAARANNRFTGIIGRLIARLRGVKPAAAGASSSLDRLGAAANDNINRMQATPGNIAAQFQDVGVTAAAGMNPMIIALQQGTQLSAAMSGGVKQLVPAFKQLFSASALLSIGLVGIVAALIQMVNWTEVARGALNGLADILVDIAPYAVGVAGALALIYAPQIIGGIITLTKAFVGLTAAMLGALGIPALIVLGLAGVVAAAIAFRDELTEMLGFDIVQAAHDGVNKIIAFFVGGYNGIKKTWRELPMAMGDIVIQTTNTVIDGINTMINKSIEAINGLIASLPDWLGGGRSNTIGFRADFGGLENQFAGAASTVADAIEAEIRAAQGKDYLGIAIEWIQDGAGALADKLRSIAAGLGVEDEEGKGKKDRAGKREKTNDELFMEVIGNADRQMRGLQQAGARIGVYGEALARLKYEQQLFNDAQDRGVVLTEAMTRELNVRAAAMAAQETMNARNILMEKMRVDHQDQMWMLEREREQLGLMGQALDAYTIETELLNQARQAGVDLTSDELRTLRERATAEAAVRAEIVKTQEAIRKQQEALQFNRDAMRDFFGDLIQGAKEGESFFKIFANAAISLMDKIIDRMMDQAIDSFFDNFSSDGSKGGGIGGFLRSIFGSAKGNAFGNGHINRYAKGGDFTNSVVSQPTLFSFAKGTQLGEMGEAGPEAIMPLKRGRNGSLGVEMQGPVRVVVGVNDDRFNAYVDSRASSMDAKNAPAVANAGANVARSKSAFEQTRRLA